MNIIHLAAMDMDGTLLDDQKKVSEETLRVLEALKARGIPTAFSTGRPLPEVTLYPELTKLIPYAILSSGALVMDLRSGAVLQKSTIPAETVLTILRLAAQEDVIPHLMSDTDSVCRERDIGHFAAHHMGVYEPMYRQICVKVEDMEPYVRAHPDRLIKLNLYHTDPAARARTEERLQGLPVQLVHAEYSSLECTAPGIGKDSGLAFLCRFLGTTPDHALAAGDSDNDLSMLKAAGLGVAMGNAPEAIRAAADYVTADNNHDGVAEALKRFLPLMQPPKGYPHDRAI